MMEAIFVLNVINDCPLHPRNECGVNYLMTRNVILPFSKFTPVLCSCLKWIVLYFYKLRSGPWDLWNVVLESEKDDR